MIMAGLIAAQNRPVQADAYADLVTGIAGLVAYWRFESATQIADASGNGHNGSYPQSPAGVIPSLVTGESVSSAAVDFAGGYGEAPDAPALHLAAGSISLWFKVTNPPSEKRAIFSKDVSGLNDGDFSLTLDDEGELLAQFQDPEDGHRISATVSSGTTYHCCATWSAAGFDLWLDGRHIGTNPDFTGGWANNTNALQFMRAPWAPAPVDGALDEVALYGRVLSDADIVALARRSDAPVAGPTSAIVVENGTVVIDVAGASQWVGRKADLVVTITQQPAHGSASVNADNDIEVVAAAVGQDETDGLQYTIQDTNGTSEAGLVSLTVQNEASAGGGTLIYRWEANGSWIDGVPLANRSGSIIAGNANSGPSPNRWVDGASVGGEMVRKVRNKTPSQSNYCWNYAPPNPAGANQAGESIPCLEMYCQGGESAGSGIVRLYVELFEPFTRHLGSSGHLRVIMELKTSKSSDPTTHKSTGLGPTSGSYPNFTASHSGAQEAAVKYFCHLYHGDEPRGPSVSGGPNNWWNYSDSPIDGCQHMYQSGGSSKLLEIYTGAWDRPRAGGSLLADRYSGEPRGTIRLTDPGIDGYWHKLEMEMKMQTPSTVDSTYRRSNPPTEPSYSCDGFIKLFVTPDMDGELVATGSRQVAHERQDIGFCPKFDDLGNEDNRHEEAGIAGFTMVYSYGGSIGSQGPAYAWIRKIEVYRYD